MNIKISRDLNVNKKWFGFLLVTAALFILNAGVHAAPGITSTNAKPHYSSFQNQETFEDIRVKVLGGHVRMTRRWEGGSWVWNSRWNDLGLERDQSLYQSQLAWINAEGDNTDPAQSPVALAAVYTPSIIYRAGQVYRRISKTATQAQYENQLRHFITRHESGYSWRDSKGNTIEYDTYGRITRYADRNGITVYLERDSDGYISLIKDHHQSTVLTYTWEAIPGSDAQKNLAGQTYFPKRLIRISDDSGRQVQYHWNEQNQLSQITDVLGSSWGIVYDDEGQLNQLIDPQQRIMQYGFDDNERFISRINADGVGINYTYGFNKEKEEYYVQEKHTSGQIAEKWYDAVGTQVRHSVNGEVRRTAMVTLSDNSIGPMNLVKCYSSKLIYWYRGNRLIRIDGLAHIPPGSLTDLDPDAEPAELTSCGNTPLYIKYETSTDARGNKITYQYDQWKNIVSTVYADGTRVQRTWNSQLGVPLKVTDANGVVTQYGYDGKGNVLSVTEAQGTNDQRITRYSYDQYGQLLSQTAGESATTSYEYDPYGNVTQVTDPMGGVTKYSGYDALGNAHTIIDARANQSTTTYSWARSYDAAGNPLSILDPYGQGTTYTYNAAGDLTQTADHGMTTRLTTNASGLPLTMTDANNQITKIDYNNQNLPVGVTDASGHSNRFSYDNAGRLTGTTDGEGNTTRYHYQHDLLRMVQYPSFNEEQIYNSRGRLTGTKQQANNQQYQRSTGFDALGNTVSTSDANGNRENYEYDRLNRVIKITDAAGGITRLNYDARDNLLQVTDPEGRITSYSYDQNDQLTSETLAGGQRSYSYDANGNLTSHSTPAGERTTYEYDRANRLTKATVFAGSQPVKVINYNYSQNTLSGYSQQPGTGATADTLPLSESYSYNNLGQMTSVSVNFGSFSKNYSYTYYPNGLKKTYTNPEGITYTYYYNKNNQLTAVHLPGNGQLTYSNFAWLAPQTLLLPGGNKITLKYNDFLEVVERILKDPADNDVAKAIYQYDLESNINQILSEQGTFSFGYDGLYRLTSANYPDSIAANDETFAYDKVGNRIAQTQTGDEEAYAATLSYNSNNQLMQRTAENSTTSFTYNTNGHTQTKTENEKITEYIYNHDERLIAVKINGQTVGEYAYNPYGMRIKKTANGATTFYLYNEHGLAAEYDNSGNLVKEYHFHTDHTWMTEPLFQRTADGQVYYYQNDHLGTPQRLIQSNGAIVWQANYTAFGEAEVTLSTVENNLRFPGQYYDQESHLYHNYRRDYDPNTGRYIQRDPIGLTGGLNTYAYALNNPIIFYDPYGLWAWGDPLPQEMVDFAAAFGDTITMGLTDWARDQMDTNSAVDKCSGGYNAGEWAGIAYGFASGGAAGWRAGGKKAAGKEFSHWVPNRMGGPRSMWNGNYVSPGRHYKHDPYRYPRKSQRSGNKWPAPVQQVDRIPNVYKGTAAGGGAAGASAASNGCEC